MAPRIPDSEGEEPLDDKVNKPTASDDEEDGVASKETPHGRKRAKISLDDRAANVKREAVKLEGAKKNKSNASNRQHETPEASNRAISADGDHDETIGEEDGGMNVPLPPKIEVQPRDVDGYVPGSIVRIRLQNFVTYDEVEFRPGPYLNMVLGPNGTGKSSIACAICIGLGFSPSILGRSTEISAYVKHGSTEGFVEIELKGRARKGNIVVRRNITSKNKSSTFHLNGKQVAMKDVTSAVAALNLQVNNLCSFLPQDRVSEFAQLTPQQLLKETQKAAGASQLTEWHNILIEKSQELAVARESHKKTTDKLAYERGQNERIKPEVEKFEQRQKLQNEIEFWTLAQPYIEYLEAFQHQQALREAKRVAHAGLNVVLGKNAPLKDLQERVNKEKKRVEQALATSNTDGTKKQNSLKSILSAYDQADADCDEVHKEIEIIVKNEAARKDKIDKLNKRLKDLDHAIANPPAIPDSSDALAEELSQVKAELDPLTYQLVDLRQTIGRLEEEVRRNQNSADQARAYLHGITNQQARRIQDLKRWDPATGTVAEWLAQPDTQSKFKMQVFQPPYISVTIPDARYQAAVEGCLSSGQIKTFVTQCNEDYQLFNKLVNDNADFRIGDKRIRVNVWYAEGRAAPQPFNVEEMGALNFDCYALDKVSCDDGLKWFLQRDAHLHCTPIALKESSLNQQTIFLKLGQRGGGSFIGGRTKFTVQVSKYGRKLPFMNTNSIPDPRTFRGQGIDTAAKEEGERRLAEATANLDSVKNRMNMRAKDELQLHARVKELESHKDILKAREETIKKAQNWVAQQEFRKSQTEREIFRLMNEPSAESQKAAHKEKLANHLQKRTKLLIDYHNTILAIVRNQQTKSRLILQIMQATANDIKVRTITNAQSAKTAKAHQLFEEKKEALRIGKENVKKLGDRLKDKFQTIDPSTRNRFEEVPKAEKDAWTNAYIQEQLDHFNELLEANFAVNAGVVETYKRRLKTIEDLEAEEQNVRKDLIKVERGIERVRAMWYPALKSLVNNIGDKFSAAFDRMGCAGEIRITEVEDYNQWTLDILVKFRNTERLQLLTAQRQSGGERSLTTILYLMSLTEYARAPFSLVDEINQGMDNRAERAVHDQLVQVMCQSDAGGQYFLITPKLLPDLTYHQRMRILCVNNGEWLPEQKIGNLKSLVDNYVAHRDAQRH
ncbi:hypothetical protein BS47DRAFT_1340449 [Hydnum rufescens UP504]|uniref:Structural maintenance of chromosomes protein 5 n=1 Tax=Hydnum rufescens UP504 TaxID=1448309 RepID=A0A9P6DVV9_9AGAM|nr:hypothetical protein BS47DRAFT_1340449 [Hydnum rufescens UP504]